MKKLLLLLTLMPASLSPAGLQTPGMPMMMNCPMSLQGTTAAVANTADGVSISITTKAENVAELRRRVEQMAAMHGNDRPSAAMMQGQMMPGTVKYEVIENGARLTLTPKDATKLAEFRKQVRAHVERMQKGECSMMQDMMQGMMRGMGNTKGAEPDHDAHHPSGKD
jgi:hypothetical protein